MSELSELLRESHKSLQYLYECSHPNLDQLVKISDEFGVGARLTGAGYIYKKKLSNQTISKSIF